MKKFLKKNEKGFTLIEVMLVVLIIGIIAIIAMPKLLVTRVTAQEKSCLSNMQAIRTANEQCWYETGAYGAGSVAGGTLTTLIGNLTTAGYLPESSDVSAECPSGATNYTYDEDTGSLTCGAHPIPPAVP